MSSSRETETNGSIVDDTGESASACPSIVDEDNELISPGKRRIADAGERCVPARRAKVSAEVRLAAQSVLGVTKVRRLEACDDGAALRSEEEAPGVSVGLDGGQEYVGSSSKARKGFPPKAKGGKSNSSQDADERHFQLRLQAALEESLSVAKEQAAARKKAKSSKVGHVDEESSRKFLETQSLGVASWIGDVVEERGRRTFYGCFAKNGHYVHVDDCVYVKPEEKDQVSYIMRVRKMWEDDGEMLFRGQWLYRPQDTKAGVDAALHSREVLLSDWEDENPIACVQTKCHVAFSEQAPSKALPGEGFHYVCWRTYNVTSGRIRQGLRGGSDTSAEDSKAKKLVTQDRVRQLERQLWDGSLELERVRRADGRWARKMLQEAAHMLSEAMPTMPVAHITKLVLGNDTETLVVHRKGEALAAATVRHHAGMAFLEVELLAVKTSQQRTGFGALLVHRLCLLSREYEYRWLLTSADDTAVPFFKANGFSSKITVPKKEYTAAMTVYEHSLLMQYDVVLSSYAARSADDSVLFSSCPANL